MQAPSKTQPTLATLKKHALSLTESNTQTLSAISHTLKNEIKELSNKEETINKDLQTTTNKTILKEQEVQRIEKYILDTSESILKEQAKIDLHKLKCNSKEIDLQTLADSLKEKEYQLNLLKTRVLELKGSVSTSEKLVKNISQILSDSLGLIIESENNSLKLIFTRNNLKGVAWIDVEGDSFSVVRIESPGSKKDRDIDGINVVLKDVVGCLEYFKRLRAFVFDY